MSGFLMGLVYYYQFTERQQKVLLAMADHGKDDGSSIHPSTETLAWKLSVDRRNIQKTLRSLEDMGVLIPVAYANGGRGHATEYVMRLEAAPLRPTPPHAPGMRRIYNMLKGGDSAAVSDETTLKGGDSAAVSDETTLKGGDSAAVSQNDAKGRRYAHLKGGDSVLKGGDSVLKGGDSAAPTNINHHINHQEETARARAARMPTPLGKKNETAEAEPEAEPDPEAEPPPGSAPSPPLDNEPQTFNQFARGYRKRPGKGPFTPYSEIDREYHSYLATLEPIEAETETEIEGVSDDERRATATATTTTATTAATRHAGVAGRPRPQTRQEGAHAAAPGVS